MAGQMSPLYLLTSTSHGLFACALPHLLTSLLLRPQVNRLNDVISAFFDMLGALLELTFVTPVLIQMCWELAVLVLVCVPLFVIFQYRQGGFIITATENLLKAENKCERLMC